MELRLSTAARNRAFSKAVRRIGPSIESLLSNIQLTELTDPTWSTVRLTLTDELQFGNINETGADDGVLQLCAGFPVFADWSPENDANIRTAITDTIRLALDQCGLTPSDREMLHSCLQ